MIRKMEECGPQLSLERVRSLESQIGITFPDEYRNFLLKYNGGRPTPRYYPIQGLAEDPFGVIHFFFGIDDPIESCNVGWNVEVMKERIPANLLPIACDDGYDLICISLYGEDAGAVVFWHRHTEPSVPSYANVYRIADSFTEFIAGIRDLPYEPVPN